MADLIALNPVKEYLKIDPANTAQDATIRRWISWVSEGIQHWTQQPIAVATQIYRFSGVDGDEKHIPFYPVAGIDELAIINGVGVDPTVITVGTYDVIEDGGASVLRYPPGFDSDKRYKATLRVGFDVVPGPLQQIATEMVAIIARESSAEGIGRDWLGLSTRTEAEANAGITITTAILNKRPQWMEIILRYARITA